MLSRLVPDIRKTADLVAEISAACREQDVGAERINEAIQQLDKVTQQNASASEQMSATSEELAAQAEELQASIARFRVDGEGDSTARAPAGASVHSASLRAGSAVEHKGPSAAKSGRGKSMTKPNGRAPLEKGLVLATAEDTDHDFVRY
jgi:methyl-accepting chemotaxis protein